MVTFELIQVNQVRAIRGKEHAKFAILEDGKQIDCRWFNNTDITLTIQDYPEQKAVLESGLIKG